MIKRMEYVVLITYFLTTTISYKYFKLKLSVIIQSGDSNFKKIMQCPFHKIMINHRLALNWICETEYMSVMYKIPSCMVYNYI